MMNILALGLVLTSLVTAGFFSPNPEIKQDTKQDVIVKEGHRVVVVEFEKEDGNTKVLISPQDSQAPHKVDEKGYVTNAKEKVSEKFEDVKEGVKEAEEAYRSFSPRELVCDAYGKCKHKIVSAIGRTKDSVSEEAKEAVEKVKDTMSDAGRKAAEKAEETKENVKDYASEVSSKAKDKAEGAKERVRDAVDATKKMGQGAKEKVSEKAKEAGEMVENASERAKEGVTRVKEEGKKEIGDIMRRAREVAVDVLGYFVSPERLGSLGGILHLMGFAAAYGMCVWVTFASSYVLAGALPRHQFAMVQSKVYPVYFKAMAYSVGLALLGHLMTRRGKGSLFGVGMFQGLNLLSSLAMVLVNLLYLEPRATKVMFERMKKEKEEGRGKEGNSVDAAVTEITARGTGGGAGATITTTAVQGTTIEKPEQAAAKSQIMRLSEMLRRLNSYSSFLNVLTLMSLTWHLVHLGQRLHTVC